MTAVVTRSGYNRSMALPVRYAPTNYGGAGFHEIITEQHHLTITTALKLLRTPTSQPGKTLRILLSWVQAYVGTSTFIWDNPSQRIPAFPAPWINGIRNALRSISGSIKLIPGDTIVPAKLRINDMHIMDAALTHTSNNEHISRINACRRYLQAITLADISNSKGTRILPQAKTGIYSQFSHLVQGERFNQPRPPSAAWRTWNKFLNTLENTTGSLKHPLRSWTATQSECRWFQPYVLDPITHELFQHHSGHQYIKWERLSGDTHTRPTTLALPTTTVHDCYPTHVFQHNNMIRVIRNQCQPTPPKPTYHNTFSQHIQTLQAWESTILNTHTLHGSPEEIVHALNQGDFYIASDGSVEGSKGSFGYVIASNSKERLIRGQGPVAGSRLQSFRAESYGGLAATCILRQLSQFTGIPIITKCRHFMDNKAVILQLKKERKYKHTYANNTLKPDWDIVTTFATLSKDLHHPTYHWVRGHQDDTKSRHTLSLSAQLNCEADDEAGQYQATNHARPIVPMTPFTHAQLELKNQTVTSHYKPRIREASSIPEYFAYLEKKFNWPAPIRQSIDWTSYQQIIKKFRPKQCTLVKHLHHIAPTGNISHRNDPHNTVGCPSCNIPIEDNDHIMCCPAPSRSAWRQKVFQQISNPSNSTNHDPILIDILRDGLQRWLHQEPPLQLTAYPSKYHRLITYQNQIGWSHLFRGRWSSEWRILHTDYITNHPTDDSLAGTNWVTQLGQRLLRSWFEVWETRNQERHGKDEEARKEKRKDTIKFQLNELYKLKHKVLPAHLHLFLSDAQTHFSTTTVLDSLEDWISTFGPAIHASAKQAQSIPHYFRRNHSQ